MGALPDVAAKRLSVFVGEVVGCRRCCRGAKFGRGVMTTCAPEWRNGRRRGLKIPRGQPRESSTLSSGIGPGLVGRVRCCTAWLDVARHGTVRRGEDGGRERFLLQPLRRKHGTAGRPARARPGAPAV